LAYLDIGETPGHRRQVSAFNQQMDRLKTEGFKAITPAQLVDFMKFSGQLPRRSVLITFDTVSTGVYDIGIPILKTHGFTATVFVATDRVGGKGAMNWEQIRQFHADGVHHRMPGSKRTSIDPPGPTNRHSTPISNRWNLNCAWPEKRSKHTWTRPACFMAYPHGSTNSLVSAMVAKIGFSAAFSLQPGTIPFSETGSAIHRTLIDSRTGPDQFGNISQP
jgi:hypothetical protein